MNTTTIGSGKIEWNGIKRVLKTFLYTAVGAMFTSIFASVYHYNFGQYQAFAMMVIPTVITFLEKLLTAYDIPVQVPTDPQS